MSTTLPPSDSSKPDAARGHRGWMLTTVGALVVAGILIAVNWFFSLSSNNLDFTENKVHTLADGTRNILKRVDTDVTVKLFVSPTDDLPPQLRPVVQQIEGWLERYHDLRPDFLKVQKFEVQPASDEEQAAAAAGIEAQGGRYYFGITATCLDKTATIPWVPALMPQGPGDPDRIEFGLTSAITEVISTKKKVLGLMTPLKVAGNSMPMGMGGRGEPAWYIYEQLKAQYEIKTVELNTTQIDGNIDVLLMIHPAGITDEAQWAVDQYLLKGGHVVAFLDSYSFIASQSANPQQQMMGGGGGIPVSSNLNKLLSAWGYNFEADKVVADMGYATQQNPLLLTLGTDGIEKGNEATTGLTDFLMIFSGGFTGSKATGLEEKILLTSSANNQMVDTSYASANPNSPQGRAQLERLEKTFVGDGKKRLLAFELTGKFKTAFPEGKPAPPPPTPPQGGGMNGLPPGMTLPPGMNFGGPQGEEGQPGTPAAAPAASEAPAATASKAPAAAALGETPSAPPAAETAPAVAETPAAAEKPAEALLPPPSTDGSAPAASAGEVKTESLKEATKEGMVFLASDTDMLSDMLLQQVRSGSSNIALALNLVDQAAGDKDLMSIRSRTSSRRPFDTLNNIRQAAMDKIKNDMKSMDAEVEKLNTDIAAQTTSKDMNNALFKGLKTMKDKQREINLKIYEKQKAARKEYQAQEDKIKWLNVLLMPLLVAALGIVVWIVRKIKTSAR